MQYVLVCVCLGRDSYTQVPAQICPGLQIQITQIRFCKRACVHGYTNTCKYTNIRFYTRFTHNCTHAPAHTHIPYTRCVFISEYTNPRMHSLAPSLINTSTGSLSPKLSHILPYQPVVLPPGAPPAALPPPPALLRGLLPNAEAACPPAQEQTAGNVSTLHTQPASNAAKRLCAPACCPSVNL